MVLATVIASIKYWGDAGLRPENSRVEDKNHPGDASAISETPILAPAIRASGQAPRIADTLRPESKNADDRSASIRSKLLNSVSGLAGEIQLAKSSRNPADSFALAAIIAQCDGMESSMAANYRRLHGSMGATPLADAYKQNLEEDQKLLQQCQSLGGNLRQTRIDLLKIAVDGGVAKAAALYISIVDMSKAPEPEVATVFNQALLDARNGDVTAAWLVASEPLNPISIQERSAIYAALQMLASDPAAGDIVKRYLEIGAKLDLKAVENFDESDKKSVELRDRYIAAIKSRIMRAA